MVLARFRSIRPVHAEVVLVVTVAEAVDPRDSVQPAMARCSSSRLLRIRATSTQTHVARSVAQASISINHRRVEEYSLMNLVHHGQSIHVPTTLSCGIIFHLPKIVRAYL
jgi:hypothetical protein